MSEETLILKYILLELRNFNRMNKEISSRLDSLESRDEVLSIPEAAVFCKVAKQTVYNRVKEGTLHIVQRGCRSGILKSELTAIKR